jgi:hypothetical protein
MDFDLSDVYYSRQQLQREDDNGLDDDDDHRHDEQEEDLLNGLSQKELDAARRHFREFLRK